MGFFGFVFWMLIAWLAYRTWCRWERRRWVAVGPGSAPQTGWYDSSEFYTPRRGAISRRRQKTNDDQHSYIESLESRVSELEERLDFTERLLAERREPAAQQ